MFGRGHIRIAVLATAVGMLVVPGSAAAADLAGTVAQVQGSVDQVATTVVAEVAAAPAPAQQAAEPVQRVVEMARDTTGDVAGQAEPAVDRVAETAAVVAPASAPEQPATVEAAAPAVPAPSAGPGLSDTRATSAPRHAHGISTTARSAHHSSSLQTQPRKVAGPSPHAVDRTAPAADSRQASEPAGRQRATAPTTAPASDLPDAPPAGDHATAAPSGSFLSVGLAMLVGALLFGIARSGPRLRAWVRPHRASPFLAALERPG